MSRSSSAEIASCRCAVAPNATRSGLRGFFVRPSCAPVVPLMCPDLVANKTSRWNAKGPVNGKPQKSRGSSRNRAGRAPPVLGSIPPPPMENRAKFPQEMGALGRLPCSCTTIRGRNPRCKVRPSDPRRHRICGCLLLEKRVGALAWTNTVAWAPIGRAVSTVRCRSEDRVQVVGRYETDDRWGSADTLLRR
jgi:hypothetical protein